MVLHNWLRRTSCSLSGLFWSIVVWSSGHFNRPGRGQFGDDPQKIPKEKGLRDILYSVLWSTLDVTACPPVSCCFRDRSRLEAVSRNQQKKECCRVEQKKYGHVISVIILIIGYQPPNCSIDQQPTSEKIRQTLLCIREGEMHARQAYAF